MRFGLFGSAQARRPEPTAELTDSSQGFREWIENNVEAEALGFHSTFVVEHHFTGFGQVSASLNLLTWLGARTSTLRLGTAVLVLPWHNPVLLAEQAATLDLLSGGRLDFGIGKGYRYNEFAGFCVDMEEADATVIELTHNWDQAEPYTLGSAFGHLAIGVPDVYQACERLAAAGVKIPRPAGPMAHGGSVIAFIEDPDSYRIELVQRG